jgi:2-polyprenyl-3-methyl-5-hydroxy-6-metoxy-1,4-benzoquinol methylase
MAQYGNLKLRILHNIAAITYNMLKHPKLSFEAKLIEYHFVHSNIMNRKTGIKQRILDIGCCGSKLPIELAKFGHEVYGIDVGNYPDPKLFTFVQGDIRQMPFGDEFFDVVTAVSTVEHIGLGRYGDPIAPDGDMEAMEEIKRVLKQGG